MNFLYYLPGLPNGFAITPSTLPEFGLGCIFDTETYTRGDAVHGPDGGSGVIVSYAVNGVGVGHYSKKQVWQKIHGAAAWVGYEPANMPTPEDLARESGVSGFFKTLGDGNKWLCPLARLASGVPDVPCAHKLDAGKWTRGDPLERYKRLWQVASQFWDIVKPEIDRHMEENTESVKLDFDQEHAFAITALAANYRIQRTEASILGLFDDENVGEILRTLIDWPGIQLLILKKKLALAEAENSSTDPGSEDEMILTCLQ